MHNKKNLFAAVFCFLIVSCSPSVELTTSWTNKNAHVKKYPRVMVMAFGKELANRRAAEAYIVAEMQKGQNNAVASLDIFKPDVQHYDSATMVRLLKENNIDLFLTNAIINVKETERYVPGTTEQVPVSTVPVQQPYYNSYYNYYDTRAMYYQTVYETVTTPGYTVTDVEVLIESNLYDVATSELIWLGQSKSYTKEPSDALFHDFAKAVVGDITKNNFLQK